VLRSRRNQWLLTIAVAALAFGALALAFGGGSDDAAPTPRVASPRERPRQRDRRPAPPTQRAHPRPRPPTEAQAIERVRRRMPWVLRGGKRGRMIALTFDDGPASVTPALQAELQRLHAPATFFPIGSDVLSSPDLARAETRPPFSIASHTATHARLPTLGRSAQWRQVSGGARSVARVTGNRPRLFRPPYGAYDDDTLRALRRERALMVLWTYSAYDWTHPDADYIADRVLRLARPGAIVLMHDGGGTTRVPTLRAVPRIVTGLRRRGYRLVTVPRLLRDAPPERRPARPPSPYPG